jgi:predicted transposase YbfD/YdcC
VVCGTIASGDDYDDIVDWGKAHLAFLRGFAEFHFGIPCADWLRCIMNRIDPKLFMDCFSSWVAACWPDKLDLVAIDGKTSRRTHNRRTGHKALHLVSAFATNSRLVLGQEAVFEKSNEITAIPALIERLDLGGALVSTDAMGCQTTIRSIGMRPSAPIPALRAFRNSLPSRWLRAASNAATRSKANGDPTSLPALSLRRPSRRRRGVTGRSKTSCTGFST